MTLLKNKNFQHQSLRFFGFWSFYHDLFLFRFPHSLFRLIEPSSGRILIDGFDASSIGLRPLRSALTMIPQEPVLYSGTLRTNLDPFEEHQDQELHRVKHMIFFR